MSDYRSVLERAGSHFAPLDLELERVLRRRDRKRREQRIAAGVVGIAVFLAAVWIVTNGASVDRTQTPANDPSTVKLSEAEDIVRGFLGAFGTFDVERAMTYVADGADLSWLIDRRLPANEGGLSTQLAMLEAQRLRVTITSCQVAPFGSATSVVCGFDFDAIASDVLGVGPFTGSRFVFTVADGKIVKGAAHTNLQEFRSQMRAPFAEWVAATHPGDFSVMYDRDAIPTDPEAFSHVNARYTDASIRLWRLRIPQYVAAVEQGTA